MTRINYRTNPRKALEVILWCASKRPGVDFHTILKVLFFADVTHLNNYGRPIVGDDYVALPHGPVPQTTYDILKGDPLIRDALQLASLPFVVVGGYRVQAEREPDLDYLSESDLEALEEGWAKCAHLGFSARTEVSHQHPAWQNARNAGRHLMDYADFLEGENRAPERLHDIAEFAADLRV